jgi:hypothetical protein
MLAGSVAWGHVSVRFHSNARHIRNVPGRKTDVKAVRIATGSMGYKHRTADLAAVTSSLIAPNFLLKIIPHVDGTPRICDARRVLPRGCHRQRRVDRAGGA